MLVLNARPLWIRLLFRELGRFVPTRGIVFHPERGSPPVTEDELPDAPGWSLHPFEIPRRSLGRLAWAHAYPMRRRLERRFGRPGTVVFTQPCQRSLCSHFKGVQRIYYAADDYRWDYGWQPRQVESWERQIVENVDRIVCVSRALADSMARRFGIAEERFFVSANGMPEAVIPRQRANGCATGSTVESLIHKRPLAGVFGTISKRIRLDWLKGLVDALPWLNLALVGPRADLDTSQQKDLAYLDAHPRCTVLDAVDYYELFRYAAAVQIGLLPLAANGINPTSSPVRFYTQLPFGQPIVASESSLQLEEFGPLVTIAKTLPEFIRKIDDLKRVDFDDRLAEERRATARQHTWESRAESLFNTLIASHH